MTEDIDRLLTDEGRNSLRDHLIDSIDEISVGDGETQVRATDTVLENELYRDDASNEADGTGEVVTTVQLGLADVNGRQLSELMLHTGDGSLARIVFGGTEKTEDLELAFETQVKALNTE
jgi:hypothetical protein